MNDLVEIIAVDFLMEITVADDFAEKTTADYFVWIKTVVGLVEIRVADVFRRYSSSYGLFLWRKHLLKILWR
jgi:hypothetical protein